MRWLSRAGPVSWVACWVVGWMVGWVVWVVGSEVWPVDSGQRVVGDDLCAFGGD